jgi:hypothetical protein
MTLHAGVGDHQNTPQPPAAATHPVTIHDDAARAPKIPTDRRDNVSAVQYPNRQRLATPAVWCSESVR